MIKVKKRRHTSAKIEQFIKNFVPPAGFVKSDRVDDSWPGQPQRIMELKNEEASIRFELWFTVSDSPYERERNGSFSYSGHTHFTLADGGWVTYDRRGVDDSFYGSEKGEKKGNGEDDDTTLANTLVQQLERIEQSRERSKHTVQLPAPLGLFYRTQPEIETIKEQLKRSGRVSFHPAGFGTGYNVSVRGSYYARPADALAKFLGFPQLWVDTFDAD